MDGVVKFSARERRRLVALRIAVEDGKVSDFDRLSMDGVWDCPLLDPVVGPPTYGRAPRPAWPAGDGVPAC